MVYNIEHVCMTRDSEQQMLGIEQLNQVLAIISQLKRIISELMASLTAVCWK